MNGCIGDGKVSQDDLVTAIAMADRGNVHIQEMTINAEAYEELLSDTPKPPGMNILTFMGPCGAVRITKGDPIKEKKVEVTRNRLFMTINKLSANALEQGYVFSISCRAIDLLCEELGLE